jgi:hypothetical protein
MDKMRGQAFKSRFWRGDMSDDVKSLLSRHIANVYVDRL